MKERKKPYLIAGSLSADLTGKACSPMTIQFVTDTYVMTKSAISSLLKQGYRSFYFITVDYAFGKAFQDTATKFIEAAGGKVVGSVRHPLGTSDFSSYLLQAQASGAQVVGILNAGEDLANALKKAAEFRLTAGGQVITVFSITDNVVSALGLDVTQGLQFATPYYWDRNEDSRAFAKRFMARRGVVPTYMHAGAYSATLHYLKAVQAAGTTDGPTVVAKMKAMPINDFSMNNVHIREDGQTMRPEYTVQVKAPAESKDKNDLYIVKGELAPDEIYRPLAEGGCDLVSAK
jgi:branched-chain amino acid transport system substrate-binding protein